jgi:hypothetical protein
VGGRSGGLFGGFSQSTAKMIKSDEVGVKFL